MRGEIDPQLSMFSYVDLESRIPKDHPIRKIRRIVDEALVELEPAFEATYSDRGRPSIPPEQLLWALLLQILFTIRSERLLIRKLDLMSAIGGQGQSGSHSEPRRTKCAPRG